MDKILRLKEVKDLTSLSKTTIYRLMNSGQFPNNIKIGMKAKGWRESDLEKWLHMNNPDMDQGGINELSS